MQSRVGEALLALVVLSHAVQPGAVAAAWGGCRSRCTAEISACEIGCEATDTAKGIRRCKTKCRRQVVKRCRRRKLECGVGNPTPVSTTTTTTTQSVPTSTTRPRTGEAPGAWMFEGDLVPDACTPELMASLIAPILGTSQPPDHLTFPFTVSVHPDPCGIGYGCGCGADGGCCQRAYGGSLGPLEIPAVGASCRQSGSGDLPGWEYGYSLFPLLAEPPCVGEGSGRCCLDAHVDVVKCGELERGCFAPYGDGTPAALELRVQCGPRPCFGDSCYFCRRSWRGHIVPR